MLRENFSSRNPSSSSRTRSQNSTRGRTWSSSKTRKLWWIYLENYIAKWSKLYERFKGLSGRWISSQWKFSRYQSTNVIPKTSYSWKIVEAFIRIAAPQRRAAKYLGHTWFFGKRFCKSTDFLYSSLSSRIESMVYNNWGAASYVYSGEKWKTRTKSRSEMPVWTVSQRFNHPQWGRFCKELWGRPPTTVDLRSSFRQIH